MIKTVTKRHGINFIKVWFAKEPLGDDGIITYHQSRTEGKNAEEFDTLLSDLTPDPEAIKSKFAKNCKYEVNRAERENVQTKTISGADIKDEDIDAFITFFEEFWKTKDSTLSDPEGLRAEMISYRDTGALTYTIAVIDGKDSVYHTYISDNERTRLWHSASLYRLMEGEQTDNRKIVGMANRHLHFADMLHFKEKGLKLYDWGGAGRGEDVINITRFKESFGGFAERSYDYEEVNGLKAKLFKFVVNVLDDSLINRFRG